MRARFIFITLFSLGMLGVAYFIQYFYHIEPCPLCIIERILLFVILIIAFVGIFFHRQKILHLLAGMTILSCLVVSGRHLYLQNLPKDQVPDCAPGFDYLIKNFSASEVFTILFTGSGQCAEIGPLFLGLALSHWSFLGFSLLLISVITWNKKEQHKTPT